jgi:hypothetical protein
MFELAADDSLRGQTETISIERKGLLKVGDADCDD